MIGVAKNNRELSRKRLLSGRSVLQSYLESGGTLEFETSLKRLHCALIELQYLQLVVASDLLYKVTTPLTLLPVAALELDDGLLEEPRPGTEP